VPEEGPTPRRLVAIVVAYVAAYARPFGEKEEGVLAAFSVRCIELIDPILGCFGRQAQIDGILCGPL